MIWQAICFGVKATVVVAVEVVVVTVVVVEAPLITSQVHVFLDPSAPVTVHLFCILKPLRAYGQIDVTSRNQVHFGHPLFGLIPQNLSGFM